MAQGARAQGRYSTAGLDLNIVERVTHAFREAIAVRHDRKAEGAQAAAERAQHWPAQVPSPVQDDHFELGQPLWGPWWGALAELRRRRELALAVPDCRGTFEGVPLLGPWWERGGALAMRTRELRTLSDRVGGELADDAELTPPPGAVRTRRYGGRPTKVLVPRTEAKRSESKWHAGRAKGQRRRCLTVGHCGDGEVQARCACGAVAKAPILCGVVRLCFRCMAKRATRARRRFMLAYQVVLRDGLRRGLYRQNRRGGRWSDKHLVLTIPHFRAGTEGETARARVERIFAAYALFARRMGDWLRRHKAEGARLYRCFEWTLGRDRMGHPHFHLWVHGPWLPEHDCHKKGGRYERCPATFGERCAECAAGRRLHAGVRSWWADALAAVGVAIEAESVNITLRAIRFRAIEFVREVRKPNGVTYEARSLRIRAEADGPDPVAALIRYFEPWSIAAADPETGERASEDVLGHVYMALEGKRLSQGSRGFLGLAGESAERTCGVCGCVGPCRIDVTPWDRPVEAERPAATMPASTGPPPSSPVAPARPYDSEALADALSWMRSGALGRPPSDPWREGKRPPEPGAKAPLPCPKLH